MRFLTGFMIAFTILMVVQQIHPECPMTEVTGVEWIECLASWR